MENNNVNLIGRWSAILSFIFLSLFGLFLFISLFKINTIYFSFADVMIFGVSFTVLVACIYSIIEDAKKIYSLLSLIFSILFSAFISIAYYMQLAVVKNNVIGLSDEVIKLITYAPGSFAFALDMLGFTFLCLSVLFLYPVFKNKILKVFLLINGLFAIPTFIFPILKLNSAPEGHFGSVILLIWVLIFLPVLYLFFMIFKEKSKIL